MQHELMLHGTKFGGLDQPAVPYRYGMQFAVELTLPEIEKLLQHWTQLVWTLLGTNLLVVSTPYALFP